MDKEGPDDDLLPREIVSLGDGATVHLTGEELEALLRKAAQAAYLLAEGKRQFFATTPDGLRDKTIAGYKRVPLSVAQSQSTPLLSIEGTGTEQWKGTKQNALPSEQIAHRLFSTPTTRPQLTMQGEREDTS